MLSNITRHPKVPTAEIRIPLSPTKNVPADLLIKVIVGPKSSTMCHVFEVVQKLPKFATYIRNTGKLEDPTSYVTFNVSERINRVCYSYTH
jgi:hypothetical protein